MVLNYNNQIVINILEVYLGNSHCLEFGEVVGFTTNGDGLRLNHWRIGTKRFSKLSEFFTLDP
jgi:hypothetical protein